MANYTPVSAGTILEKRYKILRELGHGGFGRTYLAEDSNRYNEHCVLKEFAPQVQGTSELQKAEELFEREAGMLYKLQHSQIPRFRELLRVSVGGKDSLFLVQDYVEGQTYWDILTSRQQRGQRFSEAEVTQLLLQLLPVLEYIHSQNVIHRDISPDNLILRSSDKLPVLIDFGSVKQVAASAIAQFTRQPRGTAVGKDGYAPEEQLRQGKAFPCSDLYSLGVTVLVLLTGKKPQNLYDSQNASWRWRGEVNVSQTLGGVLDKMLAHRPGDRYQSAREVLLELESGNPNRANVSNIPTQVVSPGLKRNNQSSGSKRPTVVSRIRTTLTNIATRVVAPGLKRNNQSSGTKGGGTASPLSPRPAFGAMLAHLWRTLMFMSVVLGSVILGWTVIRSGWLSLPSGKLLPLLPNAPLSQTESQRQIKIYQRVKALNIDEVGFYQKVDELFHARHPELDRRSLSEKPEDAGLRSQWYQLAEDSLAKQERGEEF